MRTKLSVLRATRRLLALGGRTAFLTIQPVPGLPARERRRASRVGPPGAAVRTSYESLLRSAGFCDVRVQDRTEEYRDALAGWIVALGSRESEVRELIGDETYEERTRSRRQTLNAVEDGILGRFLYSATRA